MKQYNQLKSRNSMARWPVSDIVAFETISWGGNTIKTNNSDSHVRFPHGPITISRYFMPTSLGITITGPGSAQTFSTTRNHPLKVKPHKGTDLDTIGHHVRQER